MADPDDRPAAPAPARRRAAGSHRLPRQPRAARAPRARATATASARGQTEAGSRRRPLWVAFGVLVAVLIVGGVIARGLQEHQSATASPLLVLGAMPPADGPDIVHSAMTLTDGCLSIAEGLLVWPPNTDWDPAQQVVEISHPAVPWPVGQILPIHATILDAIPDTPSATVPQSLIDALRACSQRTGLRTVVVIN